MALLLKAAADAGLQVDWYTYYAGGTGGPTAIKQTGLNHRVFEITEGGANIPYAPSQEFERALRAKYDMGLLYPRAVNEMRMLVAAITEAKSTEPSKIAGKLEGMKFEVFDGGDGFMRADDHQFFQPIYIRSFGDLAANEPFDEEKTGWGWRMIAKVDTADTIVPTVCKMRRPNA
jgi:branched-chain amino acid transport system substrate-binding protein